ncbi:MAG: ComEC/Rec2 family competence protein [Candidatus Paracaedibacteraceae bacterium]|nr:ComEC/Rec2 family competence protein [Candidatus Paracaedibacteraceae bacterium]
MADRLKTLLVQESDRLFLWFPVGMGVGVVTYFSLSAEPNLWVSLFCLALNGILLLLSRRTRALKIFLALCFSISLGFTAIHYKTWRLTTIEGVLPLQQKEKGQFIGQVQDIEFMKNRQRFIVRLKDGRLVRLSAKETQPISIGDQIYFRSTLLPFSTPVLEEGYDYGRSAFYKKLSATGRMIDIEILQQSLPASSIIQALRAKVTQSLLMAIPGESGAIAAALVTGERGRIPEATRQAYADAGIAHVLAISGLHLSMIAGLIFVIVRRGLCLSMTLAERYNLKKIASFLTFPFLIAYLMISGMGVPAIRSFIMVSIVLVGTIVDRQALSMRTLALAAVAILLIQPENLISASFALSFAAVAALIAAYEDGWAPLRDWANKGGAWRRIVVYGVGIVASTIIATAATLPITLYVFNRISMQAIIGNLVAIPLMGFLIMPLLLIGVLLLPFGQCNKVFNILDQAIAWMTKVAHWTATLPGAAIQVAKPPETFMWLMVSGGLWLCLWRTKGRFLGIIPCLIALSLLWHKPAPFIWLSPEAQIYWYDGQTLSTFANARPNSFVREVLLRQLGLKKIQAVTTDTIQAMITRQPVVLFNEKFSYQNHGSVYQNAQVIISCRYLPAFLRGKAKIVLDKTDLGARRGIFVRFDHFQPYVVRSVQNRPWRVGE